ncbi:hypothetical protein FRB99_001065 [Tulasnella sp. 403]|nr:hypothetical protein FRB99_001065 [Tulasnella sp. 403]
MPLEYPEPFPAVPTLAEWTALWSLWDNITTSMIPPNMLHVAPIDLRHRCLFYFGHIPTFLDIHLTRILRKIGNKREEEGHTGPVYFKDLFERGIDPSVDDPSQIHVVQPHSEVPTKDEDWPSLETVLGFRDRVRARLIRVYEEYSVANKESLDPTVRDFDRQLARVLWMTWEHEAMHAETLLYMLIQKAGEPGGTLPPKGFLPPAWDVLQKKAGWSADVTAAPTVTIEPTTVFLGHDDIEADDSTAKMEQRYEFGWDSENPKREAQITSPIRIETRPVLNGEFYAYWKGVGEDSLPAQWTKDDEGNIMVRTLYGPVPLSVAKNWPFIGSYDELQAYATSKGGRLPSEPELRHYVDVYGDSDESNVGFKNWHPIPPKLPESGQRGHNGGVWEWTSTIWDTHEGFQKSILYPGFSSDFFDGQHHAVLGASYATVPRIAQRRSFRNWYQHNYRYAWIGGRVVYDI